MARTMVRAVLVVVLLVCAAPGWAQLTTASIRGTVTDATGAIVPGATVTVKGEQTGFTRETSTNADGFFSLSELPVGTYTFSVSLTGFKSATRTGIVLNVADVRAEDIKLEAGAISESVTVESAALAVKTIGGEVAGLVTGEQVRELP